MNRVVTVGLDGTPESLSAARWAAREAQQRNATLRMTHAWVLLSDARDHPPTEENDPNYWPKWITDQAMQSIEPIYPDLPVVEDLVAEDPVDALLAAAKESELLVLGSRDMSPMASYFLGDVGLHVMVRSRTPTVLVRAREDSEPPADEGDVVVALSLDGPCDALLEFAFTSSARRNVNLRAVHGRNLPAAAYTRGGIVADPYLRSEVIGHAQRELADMLCPWREKFGDVRVVDSVWAESPAKAVIRGAVGAGLLVVGRRQKGPRASPPVGNVLAAAVHHAPCPLAVVPLV
ncbi:stress-inducible protein [Streptomyces camponoticapitis]|uniref:Stress-inducible protein n=1 Tax=Streptomyces camponoticapitis TaxID=1616125 RepID=A0ABQ2ES95_9ACTN|nr:universal stress protein [Streptomyces camponoticapitis]GGK23318.1 stress-inducible protein [Streptomyces camponoticapitis]